MLWEVNEPTLFVKSRLSRGPIYLPNGFPGSFLKMVNFEMSRRYRESSLNPIYTCIEYYLYSSITQNGGAIIPYFESRKAFCILFISGSTLLTLKNSSNWSLYISLKGKVEKIWYKLKHFLLGDNFINSKNLISWPCMDIVSQKKIDVGHYWDLKG